MRDVSVSEIKAAISDLSMLDDNNSKEDSMYKCNEINDLLLSEEGSHVY